MIRARLYDAHGRDREIDPEPGIADRIKDRQLLWIDVEGTNFWVVVGVMAVFGVSLLATARWRGWL